MSLNLPCRLQRGRAWRRRHVGLAAAMCCVSSITCCAAERLMTLPSPQSCAKGLCEWFSLPLWVRESLLLSPAPPTTALWVGPPPPRGGRLPPPPPPPQNPPKRSLMVQLVPLPRTLLLAPATPRHHHPRPPPPHYSHPAQSAACTAQFSSYIVASFW